MPTFEREEAYHAYKGNPRVMAALKEQGVFGPCKTKGNDDKKRSREVTADALRVARDCGVANNNDIAGVTDTGLQAAPNALDLESVVRRTRPLARAPRHQPGAMNKTEEAYAAALEARRIAGEIHAYWFESMTLKIGIDCRVTIDFMVQLSDGTLELHDAKGGKVNAAGKIVAANMRDDAHAKYAVAAKMYPFPIRIACGVAGTKTRAWQWGIKRVGAEVEE